MGRTIAGVVVVSIAIGGAARADGDGRNVLAGPLLGIRLGGPPGSRLVAGVEGGGGIGPERINLGYEYRLDQSFGYVELDPWYWVGASLGFGIDSDGNASPIIGAWEGAPLLFDDCHTGYRSAITLAFGYRWSGVHEIYATLKAGVSEELCLDN